MKLWITSSKTVYHIFIITQHDNQVITHILNLERSHIALLGDSGCLLQLGQMREPKPPAKRTTFITNKN